MIAQCHPNRISGSLFFMNSDCSSGVHWFVFGAVVEPALHVILWHAKGSELYMRPKGIPVTTTALGLQHHDGWMCGYQSLSLLRQLLETEPSNDFGMFTAERMPPAFVTHVQDIMKNAPQVPCPFFSPPLSPFPQQLTCCTLHF